jgi:hypothetical protein
VHDRIKCSTKCSPRREFSLHCSSQRLTATSFGAGLPAAALSGAAVAAVEAVAVASAAVAGGCFALSTALLVVAAFPAPVLPLGDLCFAAAALPSAAGPAFCSLAELLPFSADIPAKRFCSGLVCFLGGAAACFLRSGCRAFTAGCAVAGLLGAGSPVTYTSQHFV